MTDHDNFLFDRGTSLLKEFQNNRNHIVNYKVEHQDFPEGKTILKSGKRFHRISYKSPDHNMEILADNFGNDAICEFVRLTVRGEKYLLLILPDEYDVLMSQGVGWLCRSSYPDKFHYWLPLRPIARTYEKFDRIIKEESLPVIKIDILRNDSCALFKIPEGYDFIEFVVWTLPSGAALFEELYSLSSQELQRIFLWGSHTSYSGPKDIYRHIIHGHVYENRWAPPQFKWKSFSEIDAHALYIIMHGLWGTTRKQIYQNIKDQIVYSVAARQEPNGAWRQGLYTEDHETHYRYQCSGIHMLTAAYEETHLPVIKETLEKAVEYLELQCEELNVGTWYLHDSLEQNAAAIRKSPLPFLKSRAFGKSTSNMLVLNTHLDTLVALSRYDAVTGRLNQGKRRVSGSKAVIAVLDSRPADFVYRILFKAIELTFVPISRVKSLSLQRRTIRKLARLILIPLLPWMKKFFPRLVMPNGYIGRDLSIGYLNHEYLSINIWDLLRFQKPFNIRMVDPIIHHAVDYAMRSGLVERWSEEKSYALGFWSEAMYLECIRRPERSRKVLADAVITLSDSERGVPPSLLGCNPEYIPLESQVPCIRVENDHIVIVNLSTNADDLEFLLINITDSPQEAETPQATVKWVIRNSADEIISPESVLVIPPRDWIRLKWI